jgi:hypothetical protein
VYQRLLAYKPQKLPQVPTARNLKDIELVLVCLAELYPSHKLISWLDQIILWEGEQSNLTLLAMGLFTIYHGTT